MKTAFVHLIHLLLISLPVALFAQSLDDLTVTAYQNNLELKVLEKEYLAALEKAPQVSQLPDPEAGIGVFPYPVETRLGAQTIRLSATQMLPWPGLLEGKKELETAKARALYEKIHARQLELNYEIELAWLKLYEITESQEIIRRNIYILESLEQIALAKVESGKATAADVITVQLKSEALKEELKILESAKVAPVVTINQLLNRDLSTPVQVTDTLSPAILPYEKNALMAGIRENHPMFKMFDLQQDVSLQSISLNHLNGKPSFGVGLDYIMVDKRTDAEPVRNGRDILQLRASVKVPLFRKQYDAREREENIRIEALDYQKEDTFNRFKATIEKAYATLEEARLKINLYQKQSELAGAAIRILETNYSTTGDRFDELLRLEMELVEYDLKILRAIVQSHVALSSIDRFIAK